MSTSAVSGGAKKKHGRNLQAAALARENSLQKQLANNIIFQRQQQRLSAALADEQNQVRMTIRILKPINLIQFFLKIGLKWKELVIFSLLEAVLFLQIKLV